MSRNLAKGVGGISKRDILVINTDGLYKEALSPQESDTIEKFNEYAREFLIENKIAEKKVIVVEGYWAFDLFGKDRLFKDLKHPDVLVECKADDHIRAERREHISSILGFKSQEVVVREAKQDNAISALKKAASLYIVFDSTPLPKLRKKPELIIGSGLDRLRSMGTNI